MDDSTLTMSFLLAFLVVLLFVVSLIANWYRKDAFVSYISLRLLPFILLISPELDAIPTAGDFDPMLSYFSALLFSLPILKNMGMNK